MIGLNLCAFCGNLAADPILRQTRNGKVVLNFTLAVPDEPINGHQSVEFVPVAVWGSNAPRLATLLRKGSRVTVSGKFTTSATDGRDGEKRYYTKIAAHRVVLMGGSEYDRTTSDLHCGAVHSGPGAVHGGMPAHSGPPDSEGAYGDLPSCDEP